jgi:hypothetical protein
MRIHDTEFYLLRTFRDRMAPLAGSRLPHSELDPLVIEAGQEIISKLINGHGHTLPNAVGLLYSIVKELDIQPQEAN